jgi:hypothetical protein
MKLTIVQAAKVAHLQQHGMLTLSTEQAIQRLAAVDWDLPKAIESALDESYEEYRAEQDHAFEQRAIASCPALRFTL